MFRRCLGFWLILVASLGLSLQASGQDKSVDEQASRLVEAKSEAERNAIFEHEKYPLTPDLVQAVIKQGWGQRAKGKLDQAERDFVVARELAERIQDQAGLCDALLNVGIVYDIKGEHQEAISYFSQSLKLAELLDDKKRIAKSLMDSGIAYHGLGDWDQELAHYSKAQVVAESIPDNEIIAKTSSNLGEFYRVIGNLDKSMEHFQKAAQAFEAGHVPENRGTDTSGLAKAWRGIGVVYLAQGNYSMAMEYFQRSLKALEQSDDQSFLVVLMNDVGQVYEFQEDYPHALHYYRRGLALSEKRGLPANTAQFLQDIGIVEEATGQYKAASDDLHKSLAECEKENNKENAASVWMDLGGLEGSQGHTQAAIEAWQKGLSLSESAGVPQNVGIAASEIALLYIQEGKLEEALAFSERGIKVASQLNSKEALWKAKHSAGLALQGLGRTEQARQSFLDAISTVELLRTQVAGGEEQKQSFFSARLAPYYGLVELLDAQKKPDEALAYAERAKGRALLDVLQSGKVQITKAMNPVESEKEEKLQFELVSLNKQLEQESGEDKPDAGRLSELKGRIETAHLQYGDFLTSLYATHPALQVQRGQMQPVTLDEAARLLPDSKSAFVEFVVADDKTLLYVITRDDVDGEISPHLKSYSVNIAAEALKKKAELFRQQLGRRDLAFRALSHALYRLLLRPAREELAGKNVLMIVPDGPLWDLPFQALLQDNNRYLLEDCAVSYAPSLTVLREMMRVRQNDQPASPERQTATLLAMADPVLGKETLARASSQYRGDKPGPLPDAQREALALRGLYGNDKSEVYIGAEAGEDRFKAEAGKFRVLHLATHGIFNDASPMYSHILLSRGQPDSKEDGLLEAWEIMQMDLKADLAVLSACETGRGHVSAGEGMIGLTWAFFVAGVPTTVVSQWKVESASTAKLMLAFHRMLRAGDPHASPAFATAKALQRAEVQLLHSQEYAHPFYWAGFVLVGNPQ